MNVNGNLGGDPNSTTKRGTNMRDGGSLARFELRSTETA